MRASFLAQERADIAEAVKRMAQGMAKPKLAHWELLKRLARYLIKYPNICLVYHQQRMPDFLRIAVDSDFAGDKVGRRSTTGMVQFFGSHVLKATSNLQTVLGLNVSEAEYYALTHGAAHGLGMQSYFQDIGLSLGVVLESDSSSAKSFASRQGARSTKTCSSTISLASTSRGQAQRSGQEDRNQEQRQRHPDEGQRCNDHRKASETNGSRDSYSR